MTPTKIYVIRTAACIVGIGMIEHDFAAFWVDVLCAAFGCAIIAVVAEKFPIP